MESKAIFRGLYLDAEAETGYLRDRNVFGDAITIEDTMNVSVRYRSGALLSYHLVAYAPWEGLRVAVTGTEGRLELDVVESINHLQGDEQATGESAGASKGPYKRAELRLYPMFGQARNISVPVGDGGHGGADPVMLERRVWVPSLSVEVLAAQEWWRGAEAAKVGGLASSQPVYDRAAFRKRGGQVVGHLSPFFSVPVCSCLGFQTKLRCLERVRLRHGVFGAVEAVENQVTKKGKPNPSLYIEMVFTPSVYEVEMILAPLSGDVDVFTQLDISLGS